ncbi:uncharacterized protein ISCGN_032941 [Ixodes scapularis]
MCSETLNGFTYYSSKLTLHHTLTYSCCVSKLQVSFHGFPKTPSLQNDWIIAVKRAPPFNFAGAKVCSRHFTARDFVCNVANGRKMLHTNAVPSVFAFKKPSKQRKAPKVREALKQVCHPPQLQAERASAPIDEAPEDISMELEDDTENVQAQQIHPGGALQNVNTENERDKELQKLRRHIACLEQELLQVKNKNYRLEEEKQLLKISCNSMTAKLRSPLDKAKNSNDDFLFYTGLPSYKVFQALLKYLDPGVQGSHIQYGTSSDAVTQNRRPPLLTVEEQLFLTLAKLRLGLFEKDLANRFNISQSTVSRIFSTWVNFLFLRLCELRLWQSRELINRRMPEEFKRCYGCISDKELVKKSGFLDLPFDDNDSVMADKGFKISDLLQPLGVRLNLPPFCSSNHTWSTCKPSVDHLLYTF